MTFEYLRVNFWETRNVLGNGAPIGVTNQVMALAAGDYIITLDGPACTPAELDVELNGTSSSSPMIIQFS
jgi:hypothetical protein